MLAIVDYGMGNLRSVQKAFELLGKPAVIIQNPDEVRRAERLVLPGVGAFGDAIATLKRTGLAEALKEFAASGRPLLGICLGMQLLVEEDFEDGRHVGLGLIAGDCVRFTVDAAPQNLKVPHMGWNSLEWEKPSPLFAGLEPGVHVYFVHSYHVRPRESGVVAATAEYGGRFAAALWQGNIYATQFHPEKSQRVGGAILRNFASL